MAKKNIANDLDDLKTSFLGYDKEAVLSYIKVLLDRKDQEKEAALKKLTNELIGEKMSLVAENAGLKAEIETRDQLHRELAKRAEDMSDSLDKLNAYARERDERLEDYRIREKEIDEMEVHAEERSKEIIQQAKEHADAVLKEAEAGQERILARAKQAAEEIYAETERKAGELLNTTREQAKEQRDLYYYYRKRIREFRDELDGLLKGGSPEGETGEAAEEQK